MSGPDARNVWGEYRQTIQDQVLACIDHVAKLQESLNDQTNGNRVDVRETARDLELIARDLVRQSQDVERWMDQCGASIDHDGNPIGTCARPIGHTGHHNEAPPPSPVVTARNEANGLADLTSRISHRLGWFAMYFDPNQPTNPELRAKQKKFLRTVGESLDKVVADAQHLRRRVHTMERIHGRGHPTPQPPDQPTPKPRGPDLGR
jgi:hypothetical protein